MEKVKAIKQLGKIGEKASKWVVLGIFSISSILLFVLSIFSTSIINRKEHVSYVNDSVLLNIILLVLILLIGIFIKLKCTQFLPMPSNRALSVITVIYVFVMFALVLMLQIVPTADQGTVLKCAQDLLSGNFEEWHIGGYLYNYPNQNGIVLVFALISIIFGESSWLVIQIINIAGLVICAYYSSKSINILFQNRKVAAYSYIALLSFLGMNCYVTFVYGTIFGMTVASAGIYNVIKYVYNRKLSNGIIGVLLVCISFLFKENYLIFIVAVLLVLFCDGVFKKKWKSLGLLIVGLLVCIIVNLSTSTAINLITDTEISKGVPSKAWVAMGLQEGKRAPGWYNAYNVAVYADNGYDNEKVSKVVDKDIKERLEYFKQNGAYTLDFFGKKIASQWNEGTFQGFWIMETRKQNTQWPETATKIIYTENELNSNVTEICDFLLSFLWLGVVFFIILGWKELDIYKLIYAIIFIGGFIFHLFWEAKAQYTVVYVYFIIPYMVKGYQLFFSKCADKLSEKIKIDK